MKPQVTRETTGRGYGSRVWEQVQSWVVVAGRRMVSDGQMFRKPGSEVVADIQQTATCMGRQESGSGTEGFGVLQESDEAGRSGTGKVGNG